MGPDERVAGWAWRRRPRRWALATLALVVLASGCQPPPEVHLFVYGQGAPGSALTTLEAQADEVSPAPSLGLMVSLRVKPWLRAVWIGWHYTRFGIASVVPWTPDPGIISDPGLEVRFKLPSSLGTGTYTDHLEVVACLDAACDEPLPETTVDVTTTYRVVEHQPPVIESLQPAEMIAGDGVREVTVRGRGFTPQAAVSFGDLPVLATRFVNTGQLVAELGGLPPSTPGDFAVTVRTSQPIVEVSPPVLFGVYPGVPPTLLTLSPRAVLAGSPALQLSVQGSDFVRGTRVRWDGLDLPTTYRSSTLVLADVPAAALAAPAFPPVEVHTLGLTSPFGASFFVVGPEAPSADSLSPATARAGTPGLVLFVFGRHFSPGCTLLWNGAARRTYVGSPTWLSGELSPEDLAVAGAVQVAVACTLGGAGPSDPLTFQVTPIPTPVPDAG